MTDYARLRLSLEVSDASDYSRPRISGFEVTAVPDEYRVGEVIEVATTPGQTYTLSHLASLTDLIIKNLDTTNYVTVTWRSVANTAGSPSSVDNICRLAAGKMMILNDVTVANNLTLVADTAALLVEISYLGT